MIVKKARLSPGVISVTTPTTMVSPPKRNRKTPRPKDSALKAKNVFTTPAEINRNPIRTVVAMPVNIGAMTANIPKISSIAPRAIPVFDACLARSISSLLRFKLLSIILSSPLIEIMGP